LDLQIGLPLFATPPIKSCFNLQMTKKEQFLTDHNRLSPSSMQATMPLLSHFRTDKRLLFKDDNWNLDKLRRPFITWLTSLKLEEREAINKEGEV